jgi:adenosine deaminase
MFDGHFSAYYKQFCAVHRHENEHRVYGLASMALITAAVDVRDRLSIPVVALDIAGAEAGFPAKAHLDAYEYAHLHFVGKVRAPVPSLVYAHLHFVGKVIPLCPLSYTRTCTSWARGREGVGGSGRSGRQREGAGESGRG